MTAGQLRVVVWSTGGIGSIAIRAIHAAQAIAHPTGSACRTSSFLSHRRAPLRRVVVDDPSQPVLTGSFAQPRTLDVRALRALP
jgi:hypothetical protein